MCINIYLCSLKLLALYLCVTSLARLLGRLIILIASNGHFCNQIKKFSLTKSGITEL